MKTIAILFIPVMIFPACLFSQEFDWIVSSGVYAICRSGASDQDNNLCFVGEFAQSIQFGDTTLNNPGTGTKIFIVKVDSSGQVLWARSAGGGQLDYCFEVVCGSDQCFYITGNFYGTSQFGQYTLYSAGTNDVFLAKYSSEGECLWVRQGGGPNYFDNSMTLALDTCNNCYITGCFDYEAQFGDTTLFAGVPSGGNPNEEWGGEIFLSKYDPDGGFIWARYIPGTHHINRGHSLVCDANNQIWMNGKFEGELWFENDTLVSYGDFDIFMACFDANGQICWSDRAGGSNHDKPSPSGIGIDNYGNIYHTGYFQETAFFGNDPVNSAGGWDLFLVKYDPLGQVSWIITEGGTENDRAYGMAIHENDIYLTGYFLGQVFFGGNQLLTSMGSKDIFVSRYSTNGDFIWATQAGGPGEDWAFHIHRDPNTGIYLGGFHHNGAIFGDTVLNTIGYQNQFFGSMTDTATIVMIEDQGESFQTGCYPNPFRSRVNFTITLTEPEAVILKIFSLTGQEPETAISQPFSSGTHLISMDLESLPPGIYVYFIGAGTYSEKGKLIKTAW
ncbi:MAG: T9SS type A sorting domain-containing protein [Bacteroidales bacterium]|nr:T9SS type A sorting domain-containing protein [Bacteroidales bacterium]